MIRAIAMIKTTTATALAIAVMILYGCGGDKPDRRNPYGEMVRGLKDKGAHKKGYGFND